MCVSIAELKASCRLSRLSKHNYNWQIEGILSSTKFHVFYFIFLIIISKGFCCCYCQTQEKIDICLMAANYENIYLIFIKQLCLIVN